MSHILRYTSKQVPSWAKVRVCNDSLLTLISALKYIHLMMSDMGNGQSSIGSVLGEEYECQVTFHWGEGGSRGVLRGGCQLG